MESVYLVEPRATCGFMDTLPYKIIQIFDTKDFGNNRYVQFILLPRIFSLFLFIDNTLNVGSVYSYLVETF